MMLVVPRDGVERILPALMQDPKALQEDLVSYVMAGLEALSAAHCGAAKASAKAAPARRAPRRG